jgi:hypothetical protein
MPIANIHIGIMKVWALIGGVVIDRERGKKEDARAKGSVKMRSSVEGRAKRSALYLIVVD